MALICYNGCIVGCVVFLCFLASRSSTKVALPVNSQFSMSLHSFNGVKVVLKIVDTMAKRLYIGNLSFDTTNDGLMQAFSQAGAVNSATVMIDKMTGRSRGFGFVEMADDEGAMKAIEMWNGKDLDGRQLTVNEARPMTDRPARRPGGFGGGMGGGRGPRTYSSQD